jgi:hypothetical protein
MSNHMIIIHVGTVIYNIIENIYTNNQNVKNGSSANSEGSWDEDLQDLRICILPGILRRLNLIEKQMVMVHVSCLFGEQKERPKVLVDLFLRLC